MDSQLIGAFALMILAYFGVQFDMELPTWVALAVSAVIGSAQACSARIGRGFLKGFLPALWALVAGVSGGMIIGQAVGVISGLEDSVAMILPVYLFALLGARLVMWMSTDIDVAVIGQSVLDRLSKK